MKIISETKRQEVMLRLAEKMWAALVDQDLIRLKKLHSRIQSLVGSKHRLPRLSPKT